MSSPTDLGRLEPEIIKVVCLIGGVDGNSGPRCTFCESSDWKNYETAA